MSQFIEMFGNLPIDGTIADVVERNIKSVKKNFSPEDIIEYIDISSVDSSSHTIVETSQHVVSHAPSRAQQCVESGDILVSTVRPINRNIAVVKSELSNLVASTGFCVLRPKDGFREYILSIVQSDPYTEQMCDKASGGLYPAVNNGDVLSFGIHIPDESQLKKVTYIYRQADKSKFGDFKSQFIEMFGGLCQDTSWSDVVTITNGKAYPEEYQEEGAYPICGSGGIMCYGEKKLCNGNTTILGRKGNINNPIFMESGYWIVDTAFSIDVDKAKLHPKFFYYWCCQYDFTMLNKQGVLPSLTRKDLEKVKMAIPQMRDQLKFVSIAEQADKSKSVIQKALVYLNDIQSDELGKIAYFLN